MSTEKNRRSLIINEDSDHFIYARRNMLDKLDQHYLEEFVDQYAGTDVTDLLYCVNITISAFPSKVRMSYADKYHQKIEDGQPVDYTHTRCRATVEIFEKRGLDLYKIWIDRTRLHGITPWISFRMNDAHCHFDGPHFLLSDFFHAHKQDYARIRHRRQTGYYDRCMDYSVKEVRDEWLAYIAETMDRYDPDGYELDFQREVECFAPGKEAEGIAILNDFVRDVRKLCDKAEEKWGHKVRLSARCFPDPRHNLEMGFDVLTWCKEGLIDRIVPTPRWETTDTNIPVRLWKQMLAPYGTELAPGIEVLHRNKPGILGFGTVETVAALANSFYDQGADYIYLFNHMDPGHPEDPDFYQQDELHPHERGSGYVRHINDGDKASATTADVNFGTKKGYWRLLTTLGTPEKAAAASRRFILSYQDKVPYWDKRECPLPATVKTDRDVVTLRLVTGCINAGRRAYLKLGISDAAAVPEVYLNSAPVTYVGTARPEVPVVTDGTVFVYAIDTAAALPYCQVVELLTNDKPYTVDYCEITVEAE